MGVLMRHPALPDDQIIDVDPISVPHHEYAGWKVIDGQAEQGETWPEELQMFGGQDQVRMRHPDLGDTEIVRAASAVPFHRARGWYVVGDENADESAAAPAPGGPVAADAEDAEDAEDQGDAQQLPPDNLEGRTVAELRVLAKQQGISPIPTTKPELLAALRPTQEVQE